MNEESLENLRVCERVEVIPLDSGGYAVAVWLGDRCSYLHSGNDVLVYPSPIDAAEAIKHAIRPGVPIRLGYEIDFD